MAHKNPYRPFTPDPEMLALRPGVTGNEINGLGQTEVRRPQLVYWAPDPDQIAFGEVQKWFYKQEPKDPELLKERARRKAILEARMKGQSVFGIAIDRKGQSWFPRLFGSGHFAVIADPDKLTNALPQIYRQLVGAGG